MPRTPSPGAKTGHFSNFKKVKNGPKNITFPLRELHFYATSVNFAPFSGTFFKRVPYGVKWQEVAKKATYFSTTPLPIKKEAAVVGEICQERNSAALGRQLMERVSENESTK